MLDSKLLASAVLTAITLVAANLATSPALADKEGMEKCAGIAKTGMNDCQSASHSCAGTATIDGAKDDWVYVPTGSCQKIVGGTLLQAAK
ncbi:MAG: BufA1 family periplasmic bufferin-type metallophore [Dongiaceae bacterium]